MLYRHVAVANAVSSIVTSLDKSESLQRIYSKGEFDTFVILCAKVINLMYQHAPEELKENRYHDFIPLISKWSSACYGEYFVESEHSVRNISITLCCKVIIIIIIQIVLAETKLFN